MPSTGKSSSIDSIYGLERIDEGYRNPTVNIGVGLMDECECVWENDIQVFECEYCYHRYEDKCSCVDGEIDVNCRECF